MTKSNELARITFLAQVAEVKAGRLDYISLPRFTKEHGSSRKELLAIAEKHGLICCRHGPFGYCVLLPTPLHLEYPDEDMGLGPLGPSHKRFRRLGYGN